MTLEEMTAQRDALLAARFRGVRSLEFGRARLDCRVYARAAAWIAGADRWTEAMWRELERQVGETITLEDDQAAELDVSPTSTAGVLRLSAMRRSRRVFRSSYLS